MAYYDLNSILTDAQKVPCTFELSVPGLGYLGGNTGADVDQGNKLELPLWLGEMLAVSKPTGDTSLASMDMPAALGQRVINALKADPKSVQLRAQAQHFYALGARMLELFEDDEVVEVLIDTFKKRTAEIADKASNTRNVQSDGNDFVMGLDETERQLFRAAHDGGHAVKKWFEASRIT
ncbi:hypothetical protein AMS68_004218 [Peltaster fructicola]|uniref:DNA replication complex GINS protein PSF3 n=1 Tax=Peltaster fructicola TaxID=286661 RepID=A0A6H0XVL6_9PEZI|nr:hypothetical protein AMS68_004218 [Peltaster fructicola]